MGHYFMNSSCNGRFPSFLCGNESLGTQMWFLYVSNGSITWLLSSLFYYPCPLSTAWGTRAGSRMDSQVGKPLVRVFRFPTSSGCEHPIRSFDPTTELWCTHPCSYGCSRNDASEVNAYNRVGEPTTSVSFGNSFL